MFFANHKEINDLKAKVNDLQEQISAQTRAQSEFIKAQGALLQEIMQRVEQLEGAKKTPRSHFSSDRPPQE